jgi:hypothetical protein
MKRNRWIGRRSFDFQADVQRGADRFRVLPPKPTNAPAVTVTPADPVNPASRFDALFASSTGQAQGSLVRSFQPNRQGRR